MRESFCEITSLPSARKGQIRNHLAFSWRKQQLLWEYNKISFVLLPQVSRCIQSGIYYGEGECSVAWCSYGSSLCYINWHSGSSCRFGFSRCWYVNQYPVITLFQHFERELWVKYTFSRSYIQRNLDFSNHLWNSVEIGLIGPCPVHIKSIWALLRYSLEYRKTQT